MMIKIGENIYINKYQIISIKNKGDRYEIFTQQDKYVVSEYSTYYYNILRLLKEC